MIGIAFNTDETTNYGSEALHLHRVAAKNINLTPSSGAISGDVIFELNTPSNTFLDLFKTYMSAEVQEDEKKDDTIFPNDKLLLPCMFQRAVCYINGVRIATSNNYTQDGILSRRLQFGKSQNVSVNSMYNIGSMAAAYKVPADKSTPLITKDTLDSFWLRSDSGLIVPPNSNIRFEFTVDANWRAKNYFTGSDNPIVKVGTGPKIQNLWMNPCYYVNSSEVRSEYRLNFIGINSFMSTLATGLTSQVLQYTVSPTIVKACYTMQRVNYQTHDALAKRTAAFMFDNTAKIQTLQFKHGNVIFPQTMYNFSYGLDNAYEDYVNHTQQIAKDSGKEEFKMYANEYTAATDTDNWGPIFLAPIVKTIGDPTNLLEINATFTGVAATTYTIVSSLEAQTISIAQSGLDVITTPTK